MIWNFIIFFRSGIYEVIVFVSVTGSYKFCQIEKLILAVIFLPLSNKKGLVANM